jgi:hypothetical protein
MNVLSLFNGMNTGRQALENVGIKVDKYYSSEIKPYAIELTQTIQGDVKNFGGWFSNGGRTGAIIEELLAAPEVVHFGRWEPGSKSGDNKARGLLRTDWRRTPTPQDDNIFAPAGKGIFGIFDSTDKYVMYKSNFWEVFQEMTLRHPAYVAAAVPYEGVYGPRMTFFFGVPDQLYFARDPSLKETALEQTIGEFVKGDLDRFDPRAKVLDNILDGSISLRQIGDEALAAEQSGATKITEDQRKAWLKKVLKNLSLDKGIIKPFRSYHVLTSSMHIVKNEIISSANNTFNTITVQHSTDTPDVDEEIG